MLTLVNKGQNWMYFSKDEIINFLVQSTLVSHFRCNHLCYLHSIEVYNNAICNSSFFSLSYGQCTDRSFSSLSLDTWIGWGVQGKEYDIKMLRSSKKKSVECLLLVCENKSRLQWYLTSKSIIQKLFLICYFNALQL